MTQDRRLLAEDRRPETEYRIPRTEDRGRFALQAPPGRFGQAAIEYLVLTGFTMLLLMILLVAAYGKMSAVEKQVDINSAEKAVLKLKAAADFAYIHGHPTKVSVSVYLPGDLEGGESFVGNGTINLAMRVGSGYTDVWASTRGAVGWDLEGSSPFPATEGYYIFTAESTEYGGAYNGTVNLHE